MDPRDIIKSDTTVSDIKKAFKGKGRVVNVLLDAYNNAKKRNEHATMEDIMWAMKNPHTEDAQELISYYMSGGKRGFRIVGRGRGLQRKD